MFWRVDVNYNTHWTCVNHVLKNDDGSAVVVGGGGGGEGDAIKKPYLFKIFILIKSNRNELINRNTYIGK